MRMMTTAVRAAVLAMMCITVAVFGATGAIAQQDDASQTSERKQVALKDEQIAPFLKMQDALVELAKSIDPESDQPDPNLEDKLEKLARDHGFGSYDEYDAIAASIALVMSGLDPDTGSYTDPKVSMQADLKDIMADTTLNR